MVDIIRVNQRLKESKEAGTPPLIVQDLVDLLQYHTTTYFDNEVSGIPQAHHRSGRPLKTLTQRLKGKEGRFRGSLSGKRVDFSARSVITPDPNISVDELGVPVQIAKNLTYPEKVTKYNINKMIQSKKDKRMGVRFRIRKTISGSSEIPRLAVFRSNKEIYAQLIDDVTGNTIISSSSSDKDIASKKKTKVEKAKLVGISIAKKAQNAGIESIKFDRGGFLYHGRVKSLAEGAREGGLKF